MGWENAETPRKSDTAGRQIHVYRGRDVIKRFTFTDLGEVWLYVMQWCDRQTNASIIEWEKENDQAAHDGARSDARVRVWLLYNNYTPGTCSAEVVQRQVLRREYDHKDPCHALLAACVEAARKLRAT
jgi:hypothetical protein